MSGSLHQGARPRRWSGRLRSALAPHEYDDKTDGKGRKYENCINHKALPPCFFLFLARGFFIFHDNLFLKIASSVGSNLLPIIRLGNSNNQIWINSTVSPSYYLALTLDFAREKLTRKTWVCQ